ncbi:MAG TPA: cellulase family glycosylhydrolase, partial [Polyangiaceae bacterium]
CWLGNAGLLKEYSGADYRAAIEDYVSGLHAHGLVPIVELHWSAPDDGVALGQTPLPGPHAAEFWSSVATTFAADTGMIFEPFNEPYPDGNADTTTGWTCWRDGCMQPSSFSDPTLFPATGYQALVTAIRQASANQVILLGGLQFSNTLTHWLDYQPQDSLNPPNLAASWHIYNNNPCRTSGCWDSAPAAVAAQVPLLATEIGENDCQGTFISGLMSWLESKNSGYLAWSWNANSGCIAATTMSGGAPYALISSTDGTPNASEYAMTYHAHLASF